MNRKSLHKLTSSGTIYEELVENLQLQNIDNFTGSIVNNNAIKNYYSLVRYLIIIDYYNNNSINFIAPHLITSKEELNFFIDKLNYVPLTKKYYYDILSVNSSTDNTDAYEFNFDINIYDLIYNDDLYKLYYYSGYIYNQDYINSLQLNTTINMTIYINKSSYANIGDIQHTDIITNFKDKFNTILFDDFLIYDCITNDKSIKFYCNNVLLKEPLICELDTTGEKYYVSEDELYLSQVDIINNDSTGLVNIINLNIGTNLLYDNFYYNIDMSSKNINRILCNINNFNLLKYDDMSYNLKLNTEFIKNALTMLASNNICNVHNNETDMLEDIIYTKFPNVFNTSIITDSTVENYYIALNIKSKIDGKLISIEKFIYNTASEKFNSLATIYNTVNFNVLKKYVKSNIISSDYNDKHNKTLNNYSGTTLLIDPLVTFRHKIADHTSLVFKNITNPEKFLWPTSQSSPPAPATGRLNFNNVGAFINIKSYDPVNLNYDLNEYQVFNAESLLSPSGYFGGSNRFINLVPDFDFSSQDVPINIYPMLDLNVHNFEEGVRYKFGNHEKTNDMLTGLSNNKSEMSMVWMTSISGFIDGNVLELGDILKCNSTEVTIFSNKKIMLPNLLVTDDFYKKYNNTYLHILTFDGTTARYIVNVIDDILIDTTEDILLDKCDIGKINIHAYKSSQNDLLKNSGLNDKYPVYYNYTDFLKLGSLGVYNYKLDQYLINIIISDFNEFNKNPELLDSWLYPTGKPNEPIMLT